MNPVLTPPKTKLETELELAKDFPGGSRDEVAFLRPLLFDSYFFPYLVLWALAPARLTVSVGDYPAAPEEGEIAFEREDNE